MTNDLAAAAARTSRRLHPAYRDAAICRDMKRRLAERQRRAATRGLAGLLAALRSTHQLPEVL